MRRKDKEISDADAINAIIAKSNIIRIAINDGDFPYIVPFNYGFSENKFFIHSAKKGKKIDLLKINHKVGFEIDYLNQTITHEIPCEWTTKYQSIIGTGTIEVENKKEEIITGLDIIMKHHGKEGENSYKESNLKNIVILKLTPLTLTAKQSGEWN